MMAAFPQALAQVGSRPSAPTVTITVPLYNEAENIANVYRCLTAAMDRCGRTWEVIFVNDGSMDDSAVRLDAIAATDSRVTVVHFRRNYGQTAAFMAGLDHAQGEIIVPMDGDLQ